MLFSNRSYQRDHSAPFSLIFFQTIEDPVYPLNKLHLAFDADTNLLEKSHPAETYYPQLSTL